MISTNLRTILGVCGIAAISSVAFLASTPDSEARPTLKRAVPYNIVKACGTGFSKGAGTDTYLCSMTVDLYCPSNFTRSAAVESGNTIAYRCTRKAG